MLISVRQRSFFCLWVFSLPKPFFRPESTFSLWIREPWSAVSSSADTSFWTGTWVHLLIKTRLFRSYPQMEYTAVIRQVQLLCVGNSVLIITKAPGGVKKNVLKMAYLRHFSCFQDIEFWNIFIQHLVVDKVYNPEIWILYYPQFVDKKWTGVWHPKVRKALKRLYFFVKLNFVYMVIR